MPFAINLDKVFWLLLAGPMVQTRSMFNLAHPFNKNADLFTIVSFLSGNHPVYE
jgi:hypothetical protein